MIQIPFLLLLGACLGGGFGWLAAARFYEKQQRQNAIDDANTDTSIEAQESKVADLARKIRKLTIDIAADVSSHQYKVSEISRSLEDGEESGDPETITAAVAHLLAANKEMQSQLYKSHQLIREKTHQLATSQRLADTDALTGLNNRRALDNYLERAASRTSLGEETYTCIAMIDIDHFKKLNDTWGHKTGDEVLQYVAESLEAQLSDLGFLARYGGEEFAVIIEGLNPRQAALQIDEARARISQSAIEMPGRSIRVSISSGLTVWQYNEPSDSALHRADEALYTAKNNGRNCLYTLIDGVLDRITSPAITSSDRDYSRTVAAKRESVKDNSRKQVSSGNKVNLSTVISQFESIAKNIDSEQVTLAAVALRLPEKNWSDDDRSSLVSLIQPQLRGVDKIMFCDDRTLMIIMVSPSQMIARDKAGYLAEQVANTLIEHGHADADRVAMGIGFAAPGECAKSIIESAITETEMSKCM